MVSKKIMISSITTVLLCLALGITCAIIRKFDVVSAILLGIVIVFAIIISITTWREAVSQKEDNKE